MTWAQRLFRFAVGTDPAVPDGAADLHRLLVEGAHALGRVAAQVPNPTNEAELHGLAEHEARLADRLRDALKTIGVVLPPANGSPASAASGQNHWARLVSVLEYHRQARRQLLDTAMVAADTHPEFAALVEEIWRELQPVFEGLRNLIARADPQALD